MDKSLTERSYGGYVTCLSKRFMSKHKIAKNVYSYREYIEEKGTFEVTDTSHNLRELLKKYGLENTYVAKAPKNSLNVIKTGNF